MSFWGLKVKKSNEAVFVPPPNGQQLHLSQATLGAYQARHVSSGKRVMVFARRSEDGDGPGHLLCSLTPGQNDTVSLDLLFNEYTEFTLRGLDIPVHLVGYYMRDYDNEDMYEEDSEDDFDEYDDDDEDDDYSGDDDDDDDDGEGLLMYDEDEDEDDSDDDDDDDDDDRERISYGSQKKRKRSSGVIIEELDDDDEAGGDNEGDDDGDDEGEQDDAGDDEDEDDSDDDEDEEQEEEPAPAAKKKGKGAAKDDAPQAGGTKTYRNGLKVEELKVGTGKAAQAGKKVSVHYTGRLLSNGKVFDTTRPKGGKGGKPFTFRLGVGEVIKGWDAGVAGMRVGDARRLTIPPEMGYGRQGAPPDIPGNASLVFDVELVNVS